MALPPNIAVKNTFYDVTSHKYLFGEPISKEPRCRSVPASMWSCDYDQVGRTSQPGSPIVSLKRSMSGSTVEPDASIGSSSEFSNSDGASELPDADDEGAGGYFCHWTRPAPMPSSPPGIFNPTPEPIKLCRKIEFTHCRPAPPPKQNTYKPCRPCKYPNDCRELKEFGKCKFAHCWQDLHEDVYKELRAQGHKGTNEQLFSRARKGQGAKECPAGHLLKKDNFGDKECDACGKKFPVKTSLHGCWQCNYGVCGYCKNKL